jgi:hypothetical protein
MATYAPPVDQLLTLGWKDEYWETWPDYLAMGFEERHIPELIRLGTDRELLYPETDSDAVWAPLHAWRTLALLRAADAVEPLLQIAVEEERDGTELALDELPNILPKIGPAALPPLLQFFEHAEPPPGARLTAGGALVNLAKEHPETRAACVEALAKYLEQASAHEPWDNGWVIAYLLDLKAVEAAPVIERAFAGGHVDESVAGGWPEVEYELGLTTVPPPRRRFDHFAPFRGPPEIVPGHTPKARAKDRAKARRKQARQSRKRNRRKK